MTRRRQVVIGLLGTTIDAGVGASRWERWRPTVGLCHQESFVVDRLELLFEERFRPLAEQVVADIARVSPETEVRKTVVAFADAWDLEDVYGALHDFARAYPFDPDAEDYFVHITTGTHIAQITMFLLTESRRLPARLIQTSPGRGADRVRGQVTVIDLDLSRYDRLASRFEKEHAEGLSFLKSGIDTRNAAFNGLIERIESVAIASRDPILLLGPTGSGKSQLARKIYDLKKSRRQVSGPFVPVNCATLRGDAAMSALFGHVRGAFTGAVEARAGLLRRAHGGVLFLDEIGELGTDEQAMLLRAIEERIFLPVGSDREVESDFQLIAGTNRDLVTETRLADVGAAVVRRTSSAPRFREDLLCRIDLWTFRLPSLRERREDIPPNLDYELEAAERSLGVRITLAREARAAYLDFATGPDARWSGNFRDLNASVRRMATLSRGGRIRLPEVRDEIHRLRAAWGGPPDDARAEPRRADTRDESAVLGRASGDEATRLDPDLRTLVGAEAFARLDRFDRVQLRDVATVCRNTHSLSEAGRILFAASRARKSTTNDADRLRKYLARFGLDHARVRGARP